MISYLLFGAGLVFLVLGGDWLVKGAVGLAEQLGIPPLVIGLTIVALGTSMPELVISLDAALTDSGDLAVGNVVGSNIANVLLVLGAPALFAPMVATQNGLKRTLFFLAGVTGVFMLYVWDGVVDRTEGLVLLIFLLIFLAQQFNSARNGRADEANYADEVGDVPSSILKIWGLIGIGLITLPLAAHFTVQAAVDIAQQWQISKEVIGLTIVAIGTSLPELATGISAARQGNASVAIGNVIGSNFFNIVAIIGITATTIAVPVGGHVVSYDMWIMAGCTLILFLLPMAKLSIGKGLGSVFLLAYGAYIVSTIVL